MRHFISERHKAKWIDCLIASAPDIQSGETAVVSYDRDFDRLGVVRLEPGVALRPQV
jgi:predicted nucleic-acid-binding protein